jgi:hypothetical protein
LTIVRNSRALEAQASAQFHGGGVDVVGGLGEVDVVIGVQTGVVALGVAQDFQGAVGNDLVGVHVRRRPGAALDHVHDELVGVEAVHHVRAGLLDGGGAFGVQQAEVPVGAGGGELHGGESADKVHVRGQRLSGDGEVLHRPERVDTPVGGRGDVAVAEQVVLGPGLRNCCCGGQVGGHGGPHRASLTGVDKLVSGKLGRS